MEIHDTRVERDSLDGDSAQTSALSRWRPFLAGWVLIVGGAVAVALGAVDGTLLNVLGVLGATLFLAGLVDGCGRYRGAGTSLLVVFGSVKVISSAPKGFQRGVGYGLLVLVYGIYVLVRQWPRDTERTSPTPAPAEAG